MYVASSSELLPSFLFKLCPCGRKWPASGGHVFYLYKKVEFLQHVIVWNVFWSIKMHSWTLERAMLSYTYIRPNKNTCVSGNPTLPKFTGETYIFQIFWKILILCILKSEMPFKWIILFFSRKTVKKICVPTLTKVFWPVTRNTLIFFI